MLLRKLATSELTLFSRVRLPNILLRAITSMRDIFLKAEEY